MTATGKEKRTVIVTGASAGVGRATAKALVKEHGCTVIAISRNATWLEELARECEGLPGELRPLVLDLVHDGAVSAVKQAVDGRRVHGLINNAGLLITRNLGEWTADDARRLFQLNASVPLLLTQALLPELEGDPPGHVVNIGSMGGFQGSVKFPGLAAYSASKAALANLTECLAEELKDRAVRCNCICLGAVDTAMLRAAFPGYTAPVGPDVVGSYLARFVLEGHNLFNGKVLPLALSTP
ncbi:MAG: SDR family oxidoreductase [Flavobacteriales bacterium]|jgi:short-subunit dehydrogenase|nr:SDR family oxidoreductase [Flavobacteriales bacterium]